MERVHIQLQFYDMLGSGFLRECDLENFIYELIPSLSGLTSLQSDFTQFYVYTAVRKFMFFLDSRKCGRIPICDILMSPILEELLALRLPKPHRRNWFSAESAISIYSRYLDIDLDSNGMLSRAELLRYPSAMLTSEAVNRVFQEYLTYEGEMDYKGFLDLILALENKDHPVSIKYVWRLLDVNKKGRIGTTEIQTFFNHVLSTLHSVNPGAVIPQYKTEDLFNEVLDMLGLVDKAEVQLNDVLASRQGGTVMNILVDAHAFHLYDNRESIHAQQTEGVQKHIL